MQTCGNFNNNKKEIRKGNKMEFADSNTCLNAFNALCEELGASKLVSSEECQYWMIERGYKAALDELIDNISAAAKSQNQVSLERKYLAKEIAYH
jgi:hypothetical protein